MWRWAKMAVPLILLGATGCLPPDFFEYWLADSIYAITGVVLSDAVNTVLPAN